MLHSWAHPAGHGKDTDTADISNGTHKDNMNNSIPEREPTKTGKQTDTKDTVVKIMNHSYTDKANIS